MDRPRGEGDRRDSSHRDDDRWHRDKRHRSDRHDDTEDDRGRDYHARSSREYDRGRDRDRDRGYRDEPKVPSQVLVLRNLHPDTTQEKVLYTLKTYGPVNDVRLIRDKVTGESRGFAFVEFPSVEEAQQFLQYHNGRLDLDGRIVYMDFSRPKESASQHHNSHASSEYKDWICPQCSTTNFSRRAVCYTCQAPKPLNPVLVSQSADDVVEPSPVLALRGLDPATIEASIYAALSEIAPVKEVRLVREKGTNISRGLCFVEFASLEHAAYVLQRHGGPMHQALHVDGCPIRMSYARKAPERHHGHGGHHGGHGGHHGGHGHQAPAYNAALEQAQWASHNQTAAGAAAYYEMQQHQASDPQSDAATQEWNKLGFYYDAQSGYYYNATTGYSYHPITQTYYSFDPTTQALVAVSPEVALAALPLAAAATAATTAGGAAAATGAEATTEAATDQAAKKTEKKKKKAKLARDKKISQELERWNKKTHELKQQDLEIEEAERQKQLQQQQQQPQQKITISFGTTDRIVIGAPVEPSPAAAAAPQAAAEAEESTPSTFAPAQFTVISEPPAAAATAPPAATTSSSQPAAVPTAPAAQTPAPTAFALVSPRPEVGLAFVCLLCRKKFEKARTLVLHQKHSPLHKSLVERAHETEVEQIRELTRAQLKEKSEQHGGGGKNKKRYSSTTESSSSSSSSSSSASSTSSSSSMSQAAAGAALGEGIGGQMLKRMGWRQGEGLGKDASGVVAPIEVSRRSERAGLGTEDDLMNDVELDPNDTYQDVAKKKARARLASMMV